MSNRIINTEDPSKKGWENVFANNRKMILATGTQDGEFERTCSALKDKSNFHKALIACLEKDDKVVNPSITPATARQISSGD